MPLSTLNTTAKAESGIVIDILHPSTGNPLGIQFIVCGTDSKAYRDVTRRQQNRRFEIAKQSRGKATLRAEELEEEDTCHKVCASSI